VEEVGPQKERTGRRADDHEDEADDQAGVAVEWFSGDSGVVAASELLLLAALCLSWGFYLHDQVVGRVTSSAFDGGVGRKWPDDFGASM
jgi:hypothetical protein